MPILKACSAAALASLLAGAALAQAGASSSQATAPIRDTDTDMTCQQVADEAARLSAGMGSGGGDLGVLGSLGAVARSGASLLIPGAGLALAGADLATRQGRERKQAEQEAAQYRWYYLNGLYSGKGCNSAQREPAASPPPTAMTPTPPPPRVTVGKF